MLTSWEKQRVSQEMGEEGGKLWPVGEPGFPGPLGSTTYGLCSLNQLSHLWTSSINILLLLEWDLLLLFFCPLAINFWSIVHVQMLSPERLSFQPHGL